MRVLVLCGGASSERNVSFASGDAVAAWVAALGTRCGSMILSRTDSCLARIIDLAAA